MWFSQRGFVVIYMNQTQIKVSATIFDSGELRLLYPLP